MLTHFTKCDHVALFWPIFVMSLTFAYLRMSKGPKKLIWIGIQGISLVWIYLYILLKKSSPKNIQICKVLIIWIYAIDLVINVYTNKRMRVIVYLDKDKVSEKPESSETMFSETPWTHF